jgi:CubicO group peptidase (beta-lactamase class C family)
MVSLAACTGSPSTSAQAAPPQSAQDTTFQSAQAAAIAKIVQNAMKTDHLKAVVIKVIKGGNTVTTQAFGDSMDRVPATTAMHFRNGAVAFEYVATLLMEFVDEHKVTLNDTIQRWMPTLPEAGKVTLKMLANQTTGYPDFETDPAWLLSSRRTYTTSASASCGPDRGWCKTRFLAARAQRRPTCSTACGTVQGRAARRPTGLR